MTDEQCFDRYTIQYGKDFAELIVANRATYRDHNLHNDAMTWTTIKEQDIPENAPILNSAICSSKLLDDEQKKRWMTCGFSRHTALLNHIEGITAARYFATNARKKLKVVRDLYKAAELRKKIEKTPESQDAYIITKNAYNMKKEKTKELVLEALKLEQEVRLLYFPLVIKHSVDQMNIFDRAIGFPIKGYLEYHAKIALPEGVQPMSEEDFHLLKEYIKDRLCEEKKE